MKQIQLVIPKKIEDDCIKDAHPFILSGEAFFWKGHLLTEPDIDPSLYIDKSTGQIIDPGICGKIIKMINEDDLFPPKAYTIVYDDDDSPTFVWKKECGGNDQIYCIDLKPYPEDLAPMNLIEWIISMVYPGYNVVSVNEKIQCIDMNMLATFKVTIDGEPNESHPLMAFSLTH